MRTSNLFALASIVVPTVLLAQGTGTLHGVVSDPTGAAVPTARVTATLDERGTQRAATGDAQGGYVLTLLPIGTYTVQIEAPGFKGFRRQGVTLTANQNVRVDATMELGSLNESVSVTAEAPLVDSRSSVVGTLIDSRRVLELPINGRNVIGLASLLPGVLGVSAPQTFTGDRSGPTLTISGSRGNQNLFLFDGAHHNALFRNTGLNFPPPDAVQEVKVLTNSFSAEYGRNAGSVFNIVTRSGTNELHGTLWEFLRNQRLNSRGFFDPPEKPQNIQNQFGAAAGGPIVSNQLFLFGSYEGLRVRPASVGASAFPLTEGERRGDFSASPAAAIRDPANSNQPFPGKQIPLSRFDPVARTIFERSLMPLPNRPGGQLLTTFPAPDDNDQFVARVDYNRGKHTIDARYNFNLARERDSAGQVPEYLPLDREAKVQSITVGDTLVLRPTLLNNVRLGFNRIKSSIANLNPLHLTDLGGNFPLLGPKIPPTLTIAGRITLGNASSVDAIIVNESFQVSDSLHWTRARHSVKGGFDLLKLRYLNRSFFQTMGSFTFSNQLTGDAAADFVIGRAANMVVASPVLEQAGLQTNAYFWVQDDWRVHPRLTLNLGLRYEAALPWVHPNNFWGTLHIGKQSQVVRTAPPGMVFPGDPGMPRGLVPADRNNWAPRVGFAWDPFGNGRTSVRGAYGVFYETINSDVIQNTGQPFRYTFTINVPFALFDPLRGQPPIPLSVNLTNPQFVGLQQIFYPDPTLRTPYVQHVNFNLQREVVKDLAVQVGYVAKLGRKLLMGVSRNPAVFGPGATLGNIDARRVLQGFGNNSVISSQANSHYHGLQIEVNKRFSRGFSIQSAYTFSRSIDQASAIALGAAVPQVFNLRTQYGLSDFHAAHIGSVSWLWELPGFADRHAALRAVAGGWQWNGLFTASAGQPLNMVTGADIALSGTQNQRPNVTGEHRLPEGRPRGELIQAWFNRTAFANPTSGSFGNVGRNALIGPGDKQFNLALFKNIALPVRERMALQFRSEFFNAFNHVNLGNPNAQVNAGVRMGLITSARGMRAIQFALKFLF
jgi:outer membrane receptor protein involved in Fe transport